MTGALARAAGAMAMTGMIVGGCVLLGGAVLRSPFCLDALDGLGRHLWVLLMPGLLAGIWRRRNLSYAERIRAGR
ncbi:hypothetical protein [Gluconacetobacter tumulicola]|uniref:Transmembrane protein n=1 Tax=Gluconacetobacter tumulicola TaxID=1017177 RepID=A0A7W4JDZ1_9PROT|nr:hypothetical protein [Gluconacetobacter tumulicola]MBB2179282.1 hypothetical protein [Gluconacetobacter tumulicola]